MPSYSFKKQFVPYVENGTKTQTVRAYRKDGKIPKVGELCHLFYGMRTVYCRRLTAPAPTREVITIFIDRQGIYIMDHVLPKDEAELMVYNHGHQSDSRVTKLNRKAAAAFAWDDGFRDPADPTHIMPLDDFIDFFATVHDLPFTGTVTYWEKQPTFNLNKQP